MVAGNKSEATRDIGGNGPTNHDHQYVAAGLRSGHDSRDAVGWDCLTRLSHPAARFPRADCPDGAGSRRSACVGRELRRPPASGGHRSVPAAAHSAAGERRFASIRDSGRPVSGRGVVRVIPSTSPTVEVSRGQTINYLSFDLGYEVEARGPSGISRVDLWVTRDDGQTWLKWSQADGKGASIRVNLGVPGNPQPEGAYGFRVVPVSGAGLSEREPSAGDAPDLRVIVDVTPPQLDLFPPVGDPKSTDTLVIQWKATDKNFTEEPITIEWSDKPTGPWQPVAIGGDGVQPATVTAPALNAWATPVRSPGACRRGCLPRSS